MGNDNLTDQPAGWKVYGFVVFLILETLLLFILLLDFTPAKLIFSNAQHLSADTPSPASNTVGSKAVGQTADNKDDGKNINAPSWTPTRKILFGIFTIKNTSWEHNVVTLLFLVGMLSGQLYVIRSFSWHVGVGTFEHQWLVKYLLQPFAAGILAILSYPLIFGGLLVFGMKDDTGIRQQLLLCLAMAVFGGLFAEQVMEKYRKIADSLFEKAPVISESQRKKKGQITTQQLRSDHDKIKVKLDELEKLAKEMQQGHPIDQAILEGVVAFQRHFTDTYHHGKEEKFLIPALTAIGLSDHDGPVGVMLAEHAEGRGYIRGMSDALARLHAGERAEDEFARQAMGFIQVQRTNIEKENQVLFVIAEQSNQ